VRVQSSSLSLPSPFLLFPSFFPPLPLKVGLLIQLMGLGSAVRYLSGVWAKPQPPTILVHFEGGGMLGVAVVDTPGLG